MFLIAAAADTTTVSQDEMTTEGSGEESTTASGTETTTTIADDSTTTKLDETTTSSDDTTTTEAPIEFPTTTAEDSELLPDDLGENPDIGVSCIIIDFNNPKLYSIHISKSITHEIFVQKEREGRSKTSFPKRITNLRSTRTITTPNTILRNTGIGRRGRRRGKVVVGKNGKKKRLKRVRPRLKDRLEGARSKGLFRTMR